MVLASGEGVLFLLRWLHFLAGIAWIGMLYYFNFVQTPFFAKAEPAVRTGMIAGSLVGRALWWFRWGAMITFITGWLYVLHIMFAQYGGVREFFATAYGWKIFFGGMLGSLMWFNVWFVIWPAQQVVIASASQVSKGGAAIAEAAARGARAGVASRTNTLLSIPMLFFMAATSHFAPVHISDSSGERGAYLGIVLFVTAVLELNALGLLGGTEPGGARRYMDTHRDTIIAGFVYAVLLIVLFEIFFG
jgi:uncharacterized membrane protein